MEQRRRDWGEAAGIGGGGCREKASEGVKGERQGAHSVVCSVYIQHHRFPGQLL